jgi:hypothetical protein
VIEDRTTSAWKGKGPLPFEEYFIILDI